MLTLLLFLFQINIYYEVVYNINLIIWSFLHILN